MKLIDLQEIFDPSISTVNVNRTFHTNYEPPTTSTELGRGTFSIAQKDIDPHLVKKRQMTADSGLLDQFDLYAEIVVKEKLWDMIHFPRIYAVKTFTDKENKKVTQWKMEKLIPYDALLYRELETLRDRYFHGSDKNNTIISLLGNAVRFNDIHFISDATLKKAVIKLQKIYKKLSANNNVFLDIHNQNIMFRQTQYGYDMIFSDPFAAGKKPFVNEIFEPSVSTVNINRTFKQKTTLFSPQEIGRGTFSVAQRDIDPHLIKKRQKVTPSRHDLVDLFDQYAKIIVRDKLWDMIHFPRIYAIKQFSDINSKQLSQWRMEKLIPYSELSTEEIRALNERYFGIEFNPSVDYIYSTLWDSVKRDDYTSIKDETLKKALMKLREVYNEIVENSKSKYTGIDLHRDNVMFRRTQYGCDAIFSDPFVGS